jgi:hypothetical protein
LPIKGLTYKILIEKSVCSMEEKNCMMRNCKSCPGSDGLKNYFDDLGKMAMQLGEIRYKQWVSTFN